LPHPRMMRGAQPAGEVAGLAAMDAMMEIIVTGGRSLRLPASVSAAELIRAVEGA
jgi:hypothetical protein